MMFQIVQRDPITLATIEQEVHQFESRKDARRMVAQYARQLSRNINGYCVPSVHEYLTHDGHDFIRVKSLDGQVRDFGVEAAR